MPNREYKTMLGSECLLACFQNVIHYYGLNLEESDVFILGDGLRTKYRKSTIKNPNIILTSDVHESVYKYCNEYKLHYIIKKAANNADFKNDMLYYLSQKSPITVEIDPGYLGYSPI